MLGRVIPPSPAAREGPPHGPRGRVHRQRPGWAELPAAPARTAGGARTLRRQTRARAHGHGLGGAGRQPAAGRAVGRVGSRPVAVAAALAMAASLWTAGPPPMPGRAVRRPGRDRGRRCGDGHRHERQRRGLRAPVGPLADAPLHGAWSLGSLAAAGVAALLAAAGVSLTWHLLGVGIVIAASALRRPALARGRRPPPRRPPCAGAPAGRRATPPVPTGRTHPPTASHPRAAAARSSPSQP